MKELNDEWPSWTERQERTTNHRATCGHYIGEGLTYSKREYDREAKECAAYGTYCAKCTLMYYEAGEILNEDLNELIKYLKGGV